MVRLVSILVLLALLPAACSSGNDPAGGNGGNGDPPGGSDLSGFQIVRLTVNGVEMEVWLAKTPAQRSQGFMFAIEEQLAPLPDGTPRGMLFVYSSELFLSFWMRNTTVPLDLAYARSDGTIAEIHPLVPLNETPVVAGEPVQFALEVFSGTLAANGITTGDVIDVPPEAFQ